MQGWGFANVIAPQDGFDSEAVIALPEFAADAVRGRKVLIFRGDGGRELLADTFCANAARAWNMSPATDAIVLRPIPRCCSGQRRGASSTACCRPAARAYAIWNGCSARRGLPPCAP